MNIEFENNWDIVIIGGGATGVGTAIDAASRGYKTLLVEKYDFGKGTSSKSTKLIHGGVRYLEQFNFKLVKEALKERSILLKNAPHLVKPIAFFLPVYSWWERFYYGLGLKIYDLFTYQSTLQKSTFFTKSATIQQLPSLQSKKIVGSIRYYDAQFNDCELLLHLVLTAEKYGATMLNYHSFENFTFDQKGKINGGCMINEITGEKRIVQSKIIINATGVFTDNIRQQLNQQAPKIVKASQGIHLILSNQFHKGNNAIIIPKTINNSVLFIIPWHNKTLIGTTDTAVENITIEPIAQQKEINFILTTAAKYLKTKPTFSDIESIFVGLRPLINQSNDTTQISREHFIEVSKQHLISITGGKWTTYRKMAEDVVNKAIEIGQLKPAKCITKEVLIFGHPNELIMATEIQLSKEKKLLENKKNYKPIHNQLPITKADIIINIRKFHCKNIEDFLCRRTRLALTHPAYSLEIAPKVAKIFAKELGHSKEWRKKQVANYIQLLNQQF